MTLDRRELLARLSLLLGASLSAPVASGILAGCRPPVDRGAAAFAVLDPVQARNAGILAERILPRTDTPGALDAGVDRFVDAMLGDYVGGVERDDYLAGLDRLERRARARWGQAFADCEEPRQVELLAELDAAAFPPDAAPDAESSPALEPVDLRFYRLHKELTVSGYYTSEVGQTQALRLMPLGEYRADVPIGPDDKAWA